MSVARLLRASIFGVGISGMLAALVACHDDGSTQRTDRVQARTDLVQWLFQPAPGERRALDSLLAVVHLRYSAARPVLSGQIDTLSTATGDPRYLLIASVRANVGAADSTKLFVLTRETLSHPSPMSIADLPNRFAVTTLRDLDDDGLADVEYCQWEGPPGTEGVARALGYRRGRWYEIEDVSLSKCGPLPAP